MSRHFLTWPRRRGGNTHVAMDEDGELIATPTAGSNPARFHLFTMEHDMASSSVRKKDMDIPYLIRDLFDSIPGKRDYPEEYKKVQRDIDALEAKLLNDKVLIALKKKLSDIEATHEREVENMTDIVKAARIKYLAYGETEEVVKELRELADIAAKRKLKKVK